MSEGLDVECNCAVKRLYIPDEVIGKGYAFLDTVHAKDIHTDEQKEAAMGAFVLAV